MGGGEELGLCTRQTCLSPDFKVSFYSSLLGVGFEPGTFLGMRNTVDVGWRRTSPCGAYILVRKPRKKKSIFTY